MQLNPERAAEMGRKSGKARKKLTLERVERELPPLTDLDSAMLRLDRIGLWAAAGMLTGSVAGAVVRSVEVWIRGHESQLTNEVVDDLKSEMKRLKADLKSSQRKAVSR